MRVPIVAIALLAGGPAAAGQPISESLAECSAIYDVAAGLMSDGRAERLSQAGAVYYEAALEQAEAEGRSDPVAYTEKRYVEKCDKWSELTLFSMAVSEDFRDWATYCQKLGASRDLPPL